MNATDTFHTSPYNHNCAQCLAHRFGLPADTVAEMRAYGGGRAPGGLCGALYAATQLAPEAAPEILAAFQQQLGATRCRDLKTAGRVPCLQCIATAQSLCERYRR